MKKIIITSFILSLLSTSIYADDFKRELYKEKFPGFNIKNKSHVILNDYNYKSSTGVEFNVSTCKNANNINLSKVADYDYFRFKLLLVSCKAVDKYSESIAANSSHFPKNIDIDFVDQLPASIVPQLTESQLKKSDSETIESFYKRPQVSKDKNGTFKILSDDDEIYLNILARGDFDKNGTEDLLLETEWYARNAYGKNADLIVLSKVKKNSAMKVIWRYDQFEK